MGGTARGRIVVCSPTSAAASRCVARECWIGWTEAARGARLAWVAHQQRFSWFSTWSVYRAGAAPAGGTGQALPRSTLNAGAEDPPESACAVRKAAPGSRIARIRLASCALEFCRFLELSRFTGACHPALGWHDTGVTTGHCRNGRPDLSIFRKREFLRPQRRQVKRKPLHVAVPLGSCQCLTILHPERRSRPGAGSILQFRPVLEGLPRWLDQDQLRS